VVVDLHGKGDSMMAVERNLDRGEDEHRSERALELLRVQPTRRRSLAKEVTDQLVELVATDGAPELTLPSERELCDRLGVSRNVLREALSALDGLQVTEIRGKRRIGIAARARAQLVARKEPRNAERQLVLDPIEARQILEPEVASIAAKRASPVAIQEIEDWLCQMEQGLARGERVVEYDSAFHVAIARATENQTLTHVVSALTDALRESRELSFQPPDAGRAAIDDHHAILAALKAHDPRAARQAMRAHLRAVEKLIRASLGEESSGKSQCRMAGAFQNR
jgi:GntR family transcriptional repressor for pyruvate dehydrogenase complex